jgi:hypothetical protein
MERAISDACSAAARLLNEHAAVEITSERYTEREPHPGGQEAFTIRARFPWQRQAQTRAIIETSLDEKVLRPPNLRSVIHEYGEPLDVKVRVYALEEIVAEKLRAILQHIQKLEERGWSRSRARDYYDLWRMLGAYKQEMNLSEFAPFLHEKCALRNVAFESADDFFPEVMMAYVEKTWTQWLGPLVPRLPPFATVIGDLRPQIDTLLR